MSRYSGSFETGNKKREERHEDTIPVKKVVLKMVLLFLVDFHSPEPDKKATQNHTD